MTIRRRARGIFVTGTDTGIGKTVVACALAAWYRRHGVDVGVMKPVATGGRPAPGMPGRLVSDDALQLASAAGVPDEIELINPSCYREPLAPAVAARRARRPVDMAGVYRAFRALSRRHDVVIVEGVGGLLVPLAPRLSVIDVAAAMGLPVVVVARAGLGTINHVALTCDLAARRGLHIAGIVLNHHEPAPRDPDARLAVRTNPAAIRRLVRAPVLGPLPHLPGRLSPAQLARWAGRLNRRWLRDLLK